MTEDQIERAVERRFDQLDRLFLGSSMTQADYDREAAAINAWAEVEYRNMFPDRGLLAT